MVLRLSELLERIRPVGTPGPATAAGKAIEAEQRREIAEIVRWLGEFEVEAAAVVKSARAQAEAVRQRSEERARKTKAQLGAQLVEAAGVGAESHARQYAAERALLEARAAGQLAALEDRVSSDGPPLVAAAADSIWSLVALPSKASS